MNRESLYRVSLLVLSLTAFQSVVTQCRAAEDAAAAVRASVSSSSSSSSSSGKYPAWDTVTKDTKELEGLFTLYYNEKEQKLLMEVRSSQYDKELLCPMAIARGAGLSYLGGETLNFGDQWLLSFRRVGSRLLVIRKNVRFKAKSGSPQAQAVATSYNDSVIAAVPVRSEKSGGSSVLIDLADLFMTDLAGIGVTPDRSRSTWAKVKAFEGNVEIEVSAVFRMGYGGSQLFGGDESVPDPRGAQVVIHYGLSMLPSSSYRPRAADDRVGHFLSYVDDFSSDVQESPRQRYITRWHLEKDDPSAEKSPPEVPIMFWIEQTVPRKYRAYVREGILEWNKAFEKIGFLDAIQCRDQDPKSEEGDNFDPEDIRYNTFRWIATNGGFAMGPSRTNPKTGEILDADIIFDEGMIRYWRQEHVQLVGVPQAFDLLSKGRRDAFFKLYAAELPTLTARQKDPLLNHLLHEAQANRHKQPETAWQSRENPSWMRPLAHGNCCMMGPGMQRQLGLAAAVMAASGDIEPGAEVPEELIAQAVKHVVMHEVGHTLGLRHNFKASAMLSLKDINTPDVARKKGMVGSVMDYSPANFVPKGEKQGDYFSTMLGPYDYWAIEYAYKPISGDEKEALAKIASRVAEADLAFATDEDMYNGNPDPRINTFDLGDPLEFAQQRIEFARRSIEDLAERVVVKGDGWQRARTAFTLLMGELYQASNLAAQYVGAEYTHRDHRGDPNARTPLELVPAKKQRAAIELLKKEILAGGVFKFSPDLLKRLAPDAWGDSTTSSSSQYEYPIHDEILSLQKLVLSRLLDSEMLARLQQSEMLADEDQDLLEMPEIFDALNDAIWSELPETADDNEAEGKVEISTIRRNLQREHAKRLAEIVLGSRSSSMSLSSFVFFGDSRPAPADARSLARLNLQRLGDRVQKTLDGSDVEMNDLTRAHLSQISDQIKKTLAAPLNANEP